MQWSTNEVALHARYFDGVTRGTFFLRVATTVATRIMLSVLGTGRQEVIGFGDRPHEVIGFGDLWGPSGTSGDHLGTIWDMDSMKLSISLRNRTFRSARIDPSSLPKHRRTNLMKNYPYKKIKYPKRVKKDQKRGKQAWHNKSPIEFCNYPLLIP